MREPRRLAERAARALRQMIRPQVPRHLAERMRPIDTAMLDQVRLSLLRHLRPEVSCSASPSDDDFLNHLHRRLENDRQQVVPWLDSARPLAGSRILEIGSGTGSSTVALAEQGSHVTALDIDACATAVARERCDAFGVPAQFLVGNAAQVDELVGGEAFDLVIFYASLEHLLYEERLAAMASTWRLLPPGGLWCVIEAPNRLWYFDQHTSHLAFFHWLPDELAARYLQYSPRPDVRGRAAQGGAEAFAELARLGRGVSFHEFQLSIKPVAELHVVSSLAAFQRRRDPLLWLRWRTSHDCQYTRLLCRLCAGVHPAFFEPNLDLILRKD